MSKTTQHIEKLKPCPFCGSNNIQANETDDLFDWVISCENCGSGFIYIKTKEEAIKAWNTRSAQ